MIAGERDVTWFDSHPYLAADYLVSDGTNVRMARWQPKKRTWKFPSAAQVFEVRFWAAPPLPPTTR